MDTFIYYSCGSEESKSALSMRNAPNVDKPDETYDLTCDNEKHGVDYQGEGLESVSFNYCISNKSPFLKHFIF